MQTQTGPWFATAAALGDGVEATWAMAIAHAFFARSLFQFPIVPSPFVLPERIPNFIAICKIRAIVRVSQVPLFSRDGTTPAQYAGMRAVRRRATALLHNTPSRTARSPFSE